MVVTLAYGPAALPEGVPEEDLALNIFEDGEWIVIPGSTVDPVTKTVTAPFYHVSKGGVGPATRAVFCSGDANANTFESIAANLRFNDFTNLVYGLEAGAASDLTCNRWGATTGPPSVGGTPSGVYDPWALGPIAGTGAGGC